MDKKIFKSSLVLAALGFAGTGSLAMAEDLNELIIESPKVTSEYSPARGAPVEVYSTNARVYYNDLDLANSRDVRTLETRVKTAAQAACQKLNHVIVTEDLPCIRETVAASQPRLQAVIQAAMQAALLDKQDRTRS
jgi:UrcA family protein